MAVKKVEEVTSPKFSFKGWSFKVWFDQNKLWFISNKETIKSLLAGIFGYLAFNYPESAAISFLFGAGGAYGSKLILDSIDYFITENPK